MQGHTEKVFIEDIRAGQEVASPFLLNDLRLGQTKNGRPYVGLKLKDRTGELEGRVWDNAENFFHSFASGDLAWIRGVADYFQNQIQIKVRDAKRLELDQVDLSHFLPASQYDPEEMFAELMGLVQDMSDHHLRGLLEDILTDEHLVGRFKRAPAAKRFHHAYVGGLLEHTLSLARAALRLAPLYPVLNQDLLLTGAILHDLGKIEEFDQGLSGDYTVQGRLLGHLIIGLELVQAKLAARPDFPDELAVLVKHLIISHHGEYELGSPKKPKILEGLALHLLDDLDAKMNGIGGYIERHLDEESGWTDYNRLMQRFFYRPRLSGSGSLVQDQAVEEGIEVSGTAGPEDSALLQDNNSEAEAAGRRKGEASPGARRSQLSFLND